MQLDKISCCIGLMTYRCLHSFIIYEAILMANLLWLSSLMATLARFAFPIKDNLFKQLSVIFMCFLDPLNVIPDTILQVNFRFES